MALSPAPLGGPAAQPFVVEEASQVGEVRRAAVRLAGDVGLSDAQAGAVGIIVTEAATNMARHARGGRLLLRALGGTPDGVEILALDAGPGIASVERAMSDGFSTAGTAGQGLGAMRRMADEFDLFSTTAPPFPGTVLLARVWADGARPRPDERLAEHGLAAGVVCVALAGETACGDSWLVLPARDRVLVVVADGLGHGSDAAVASEEAIRIVREHPDASPVELVQLAHGALRATRGAALAIAAISPSRSTLSFAGVGNIAASIHSPDGTTRSLASHNGTVGHAMRSVQEFTQEWPSRARLVAHSDGINTRWRVDAYPALVRHHPALFAALLFRDASRGRDDATVVVVQDTAAL